eukprot:g25088.t1
MFSWGGRHGGFCPGQEAPRLLELLQENALVHQKGFLLLKDRVRVTIRFIQEIEPVYHLRELGRAAYYYTLHDAVEGSIREAGRLACGITWFTAGVLDPTLQAKQELKVGIALVRQDLTKLASSIALAVEVLKATVRRVQQWEWLVDMETWIELTQRFGAPCSTTQLEPWTRTVPQWFTVYKEKLNRIFAAAGAEMSDPTSELAPQFITLYLRAAVFLVMAMRQCGAPATDLEREVLASHLPKELTSLHLDFVSNKHFTDEFSKELASHLPRELTSLYLGSHSYSIRRRLLRCGAWNDNRLV